MVRTRHRDSQLTLLSRVGESAALDQRRVADGELRLRRLLETRRLHGRTRCVPTDTTTGIYSAEYVEQCKLEWQQRLWIQDFRRPVAKVAQWTYAGQGCKARSILRAAWFTTQCDQRRSEG